MNKVPANLWLNTDLHIQEMKFHEAGERTTTKNQANFQSLIWAVKSLCSHESERMDLIINAQCIRFNPQKGITLVVELKGSTRLTL